MKKLEEMTDAELAAEWSKYPFPDNSDHEKLQQVIFDHLSTHPAQRIADLTGGVVTKDQDGRWLIWSIGVAPVATDKRWICDRWQDWSVKMNLPDDNRPWQESVYKPK